MFLFCSPCDEPQNDFDDDFDATTLLRLLDEETRLSPTSSLLPRDGGGRRGEE